MKVALLHYSAPPIIGGVESVIGQHARLMADHSHEVRIVAGRGGQTDPRIPFIHLPLADSRHPQVLAVKSGLDGGHVSPDFAGLAASLARALEEYLADADVLIVHNVCSLDKNLALTAAIREFSEKRRRPRLILWHHDLAWSPSRDHTRLHDGYPWDLLRKDWPGAAQVTVSELRRRELAELSGRPAEEINVVPNGVDIAGFLKLESQTLAIVDQLTLLEAAPLLLMPVRITPRKNLELALRVLSELRGRFENAMLVVTGPLGPHDPANVEYFEGLKSLRSKLGLVGAVHFLAELSREYLPDAVIADFYRLADALVLTSREEGFGIPVLEAGLAGLPVFCTGLPPLRELGGEDTSYFSPETDPEEVAALIADRLASNPSYGLRVRVRTKYAWERIYVEKIAPLLESR